MQSVNRAWKRAGPRGGEDAFRSARTAIRQLVGRSAKDEYLTLARAADLAWNRLQHAGRELAKHTREHACGIIKENRRATNRFGETSAFALYRNMACKTCGELLAAYKRAVRLYMNPERSSGGMLRDVSARGCL